MNPIVSIIVPVYHVGERLDVCVRSLLGQSYTSIEIILVNDGSTQEDYRRCEKWRETDGRVQVIHKKKRRSCICQKCGGRKCIGRIYLFCRCGRLCCRTYD